MSGIKETAKAKVRCRWCEGDALYEDYHDKEWGRPVRDSREMWETLMLEGFQAGLSWITVLRKRENFRRAFHNFDPAKVARMTEADVLRLLEDPGIIRSRAKIEATINGARIFLKEQAEGDDLSTFIWKAAGGKPIVNTTGKFPTSTPLSEEISKLLKKRGYKFVGQTIVYAWLQAIGVVDNHAPNCFRKKLNKQSSS